MIPKEKNKKEKNDNSIALEQRFEVVKPRGQKREKDLRAVERRERHEVKKREEEVKEHNQAGNKIKRLIGETKIHRQPYSHAKNHGNGKIGKNSGGGHGDSPPPAVRKVVRIIGYGLGPADNKARFRENQNKGENNGAEHIEVPERI